MKYAMIEEGALTELVSNRYFQTAEFELAQALLALMRGQVKSIRLPANLHLVQLADGIAIASKSTDKDSHWLVFDFEQSALLEGLTDADSIFVIQKTMRFAKKLWQNLSTNFSELIVPKSTKAILFPFPYKPKPYRVVIERSPTGERLRKRGYAGKFLLVYKSGDVSGNGKTETPNETNFKKAFDQLTDVLVNLRAVANQPKATDPSKVLAVTEIDDLERNQSTSIFRPYADWLNLLTAKQLKFIETPISGAQRIEGAAGTGKTLCLMLKAVRELGSATERAQHFHAVFVTHSEATKRAVLEFLAVIDSSAYSERDRTLDETSLKVCTLSELCALQLAQQVSEAEFVDRDALESKETQLLYINESLIEAMNEDFPSHERFLSDPFKQFVSETDKWAFTEMLQHEISVLIKGRASDDLDVYKKCAPLKYGIPTSNNADKGFIFTIFRRYQDKLGAAAQFDTDDVVLTTIGQLDTPIWRRRRPRDGYDAIFIDETHLFNINELHVFHYFTRSDSDQPIVYTLDRSQAVGDRGWTSQEIGTAVTGLTAQLSSSQFGTVFRSAPQIVDLAFSVVASGATLFTNFENPLMLATSGFTEAEERLAAEPVYRQYPNDSAMIEAAFDRVDAIRSEIDCRRAEVLIVSLDREITLALENFAQERKKPLVVLKRRGDVQAVSAAREAGQYVVGHADYVGGLEFQAVIVVGTDAGRLPPTKGADNENSRNYLSYASHNRLYVAISRARLRVELLGEKSRGPSPLLHSALEKKLFQIATN